MTEIDRPQSILAIKTTLTGIWLHGPSHVSS